MIFSSHIFLLYFLPLFLVVYFLVPSKGRNLVLLLASIVFYAWGAPDFILILLASTVANFYLVKAMHHAVRPAMKKLFCTLAIFISLGLLAYFKYANFFVDNANALLSALGGLAPSHGLAHSGGPMLVDPGLWAMCPPPQPLWASACRTWAERGAWPCWTPAARMASVLRDMPARGRRGFHLAVLGELSSRVPLRLPCPSTLSWWENLA